MDDRVGLIGVWITLEWTYLFRKAFSIAQNCAYWCPEIRDRSAILLQADINQNFIEPLQVYLVELLIDSLNRLALCDHKI